MSEYANLDRMIEFYDPSEFVDACKCDPDANYTCELCMTSSVLMEAKRMLLAKDAQIVSFRDANRKLHLRAQRAEAEKTDANIAGFREGFNGAEDQLAELKADVDRLNALLLASEHLLAHRERITWGHEPELRTRGYFLDGEYAGKTLREVIEAAADRKGA